MPEEQDVVNRLNGVLQFNILKDGKIVSVWSKKLNFFFINNFNFLKTLAMDFTRSIDDIIYPGEPLSKSNCILTICDDDLLKLMLNKLNPQKVCRLKVYKFYLI